MVNVFISFSKVFKLNNFKKLMTPTGRKKMLESTLPRRGHLGHAVG